MAKKTGKTSKKRRKEELIADARERYDYVRAIVSADGELFWQYQLPGKPQGGMRHDDDVSDFSEKDIIALTRQMLDMQPDEKVEICYR